MDQVNEAPQGEVSEGLAAVMAEAEALEGSATAKAEQATQEKSEQERAIAEIELRDALFMLRMMAAPAVDWWPLFEKVWSDRQIEAIAAAGAAVMERHGWTMGELMGQWGPYIALVGAVLPPSLVTYQAIKARREEQQRQVTRPAPPPPVSAPAGHPSAGERL